MKIKDSMKNIKLILLTLIAGAALTSCNMQPPGSKDEAVAPEKKVQAR